MMIQSKSQLTDKRLIELAKRSGLCFPECWGLGLDFSKDQEWIDEDFSLSKEQRDEKQRILDLAITNQAKNMAKLRLFAEEILKLQLELLISEQ